MATGVTHAFNVDVFADDADLWATRILKCSPLASVAPVKQEETLKDWALEL